MSERTGWKGMADVEVRTVEALDEPDSYAGWTVISFGDDGSVLIQSKTGARERVKVVGTVEMQVEIDRLTQENAKLREALKDEPCAVCGTRANEMLGDDKCVACERDDARYHIQRWAEGTQFVGSHRSCQCAICDTLYRKAERLKEQKEGGDDER